MKIKKPKIPFSLIVKQAGLDRAARWMPFAAAAFLVLYAATLGCVLPEPERLSFLFSECLPGVSMSVVFSVSLFFAALEFFGSLFDLLSAWLSLRKARN